MPQRLWTTFDYEQWSTFSVDEWDTFLVDSNSLYANVTWISPPSYAMVMHTSELSPFAVRRERAEIEIFDDDREVDLIVGGYEQ